MVSGVEVGSGGRAHAQLAGPVRGEVAVVTQVGRTAHMWKALEISGRDAGDTAARASDLTCPLDGVGWPTIWVVETVDRSTVPY